MTGDQLVLAPTSAVISDRSQKQSAQAGAPLIQLSAIDQLGAEAFVGGETGDLLEFVRGLSEALASSDSDGTRLRLLSKALATERAHQAVLQALLGKQLASGNFKAAAVIDRMCTTCAGRIATLARAHAEETQPRRNVLVVGHADEIHVSAKEG